MSRKSPRGPAADRCPCGQPAPYADCCGRLHAGSSPAPDAVSLMRSRYAAYVLGRPDYLLATWHPSTRPATIELDPPIRWLGLDVLRTGSGNVQKNSADAALPAADGARDTVEFVARYKAGGRAGKLHETSRFVCEGGHWYYLDGDLHP